MQDLQQMIPTRAKFSIDDHLTRHSKALKHLHTLESFDEFKGYMVKHQLYTEALNIYRRERVHTEELTSLYANFLEAQSKFAEAGLSTFRLILYAQDD